MFNFIVFVPLHTYMRVKYMNTLSLVKPQDSSLPLICSAIASCYIMLTSYWNYEYLEHEEDTMYSLKSTDFIFGWSF